MREDRAVSTTLSYVLTLSISAILVSGLLLAGGSYIDDRRSDVIEDELTVVGQQLAAGLERADRLAAASDSVDPTILVNQTLPDRVTGSSYDVRLDESNSQFVLTASSPSVSVTVGFANRTHLRDSTARGGTIQIHYDQSANALEVRNV